MRVRIDQSADARTQAVPFSSSVGRSAGIWRSDTPPDPGEYDVELEIPGTLRWEHEIHPGVGPGPGLGETPDAYLVTGRVVNLEPDGSLTLDVDGSVVMVDTDGSLPAGMVGELVELHTPVLELYPTWI
jgi:hypothetical protein